MRFTTHDLKALLHELATRMADERDALCVLDGMIGDADHGIAMEQGMAAAAAAAKEVNGTFQDILNVSAKGFLNAVGASSGPLYATGFMYSGKRLGRVEDMAQDQLRDLIVGMAEGIAHRGKAVPGQKTMIDAWEPARQAALNNAASNRIAEAAETGAASTRDMVATLGRAARLGERSLGHPDPGAVSASMIVQCICTRF